jgi:hypothetical protein
MRIYAGNSSVKPHEVAIGVYLRGVAKFQPIHTTIVEKCNAGHNYILVSIVFDDFGFNVNQLRTRKFDSWETGRATLTTGAPYRSSCV